jgi:hypothetical protein
MKLCPTIKSAIGIKAAIIEPTGQTLAYRPVIALLGASTLAKCDSRNRYHPVLRMLAAA